MHLSMNEFNVVSFYAPSVPDTVKIDALLQDAKKILDEKIESGEWTKRKIGWFRVDIDKNPEMAWEDGKPNQVVMG